MTNEASTTEQLKSPVWRLCILYTIRGRDGKPIPFRPTRQQKEIIRAIFVLKRKKLFIPKARQLGMSTLIAIIILDAIMFGSGVQCCINDYIKGAAKKKLVSKILFAFDRLPDEFKAGWEVVNRGNQTGELRLRVAGGTTEHDSTVYAGDKARGDTFQILHLSELGETHIKAPERAKEIIEGSMPASESGIIIIETTWHGGKVGQLYGLVLDAMTTDDSKKDPEKDYFVYFFPWFEESSYTSAGDTSQITEATRQYFATLEAHQAVSPFKFTDGQMLWYQKKREAFGHRIYSIYPSLLEEIFLAPVDGAIYAQEIDEAFSQRRVGQDAYDPRFPVNTLWDFGASRNTICLYFQIIDKGVVFIDADVIEKRSGQAVEITGLDMSFPDRIKYMQTKPYRYGTHYVPHDAGTRDIKYKVSWQDDMRQYGLPGNITVIPRTNDIWQGINRVKAEFGSFKFSSDMKPFLDGLAMYRLRPDPKDDKKFTNDPIHDFASHLADPLRVLGEALIIGYLAPSSPMESNLAIDQIKLEEMTAKASRPETGIIESAMKRYAFKADKEGWMWRWEAASQAGSYICVIHQSTAQIWRTPTERDTAIRLVATMADIGRSDPDLLVHRACLMAHYYHHCIVIPTINGNEAIVRQVLDEEAFIFQRRVLDSNRPIGRSLPPRKPGYDLNDQNRSACVSELIKKFRRGDVIVSDPTWLQQASTFVLLDDGTMQAQHGYKDDAIEASGIAVTLADLGTGAMAREGGQKTLTKIG